MQLSSDSAKHQAPAIAQGSLALFSRRHLSARGQLELAHDDSCLWEMNRAVQYRATQSRSARVPSQSPLRIREPQTAASASSFLGVHLRRGAQVGQDVLGEPRVGRCGARPDKVVDPCQASIHPLFWLDKGRGVAPVAAERVQDSRVGEHEVAVQCVPRLSRVVALLREDAQLVQCEAVEVRRHAHVVLGVVEARDAGLFEGSQNVEDLLSLLLRRGQVR